jgi:hypothetical protein
MLARTKISAKKIYTEYSAEQVWTAAAVAQRINGSYVKYDLMDFDATPPIVLKENSKTIMQKVLDGVIAPLPEDVDRGILVRDHFRGKVMDLLAGKANDFTQVAIAATETDVFSSKDRLAFAIVASLPNSYERDVKRETVDNRVSSAVGGPIGSVGDKVSVTAEVLKSVFSMKWNTHYVTAITNDEQVVFFAYKEALPVGGIYNLKGTVKTHRDQGVTQLNRVKVTSDNITESQQ